MFEHFSIPSQPALVVLSADGTTQTVLGSIDETTLDAVLEEAVNT